MQDQPDQTTLSMGNDVDGLIMSEARDATAIELFRAAEHPPLKLVFAFDFESPRLRRMACQCAWAAARTKNTYLSAQFRRMASRRGSKRAIIAVAHSAVTRFTSNIRLLPHPAEVKFAHSLEDGVAAADDHVQGPCWLSA